jgi:hypothetical protein
MRSLTVERRLDSNETPRSLKHGFLSGLEWGWLVLLAVVLMVPFGAKAQIGGSATIQGTVIDSTGAAIVGANVTAQSTKTGAKLTRSANDSGYYVLSPLDPGDYTITATSKGFEKLIQKNVHVDGMQVLGLNLTLQVGATDLTVTVTDTPPALETENATLGSVMESHVYQSLPLEMGSPGHQDQRRATDFAALMPGVSANETKNDETDEPMVVNGNANSSEMYIDGIPATSVSVAGDPRYIWSAFSVETVDQFQLKTSAYSAEYRGLGIENYTIKSAGNKVHGSVYGVARNTVFDAAGFIPAQYPANYPNTKLAGTWYKAPEHQTEYGISLGGPIWKNKVFLFANYMGFRFSTQTTPAFQSIPTERMRVGDFTELLKTTTTNGVTTTTGQIYDPTTQTCVSSKNCSRSQFTGTSAYDATTGLNIIPSYEVSPIAKSMSAMLPAPTNSNLSNNYVGSYAWGLNNWSQTERLDADLSQKQKISIIFGAGRQGLVGTSASQSTNVAPLPYKYAKVYAPITKDGIFEHTYIINNSLANQLKYTIMQYYSPAINPTLGHSEWAASGFGITGLPTGQAASSFPTVKWGSSDEAQWGPQASAGNVTNNFTLLDNMQWVKGKHSVTFGGQYQWLEYNYNADKTGTSPLTLSPKLTETEGFKGNNTVTAVANTGHDYASFMVGAMDSATYTQIETSALETGTRFHPYALYVNDDYKLTSKLTINVGLRWDVLPPFHETQNRFSFMNPNRTNPYTGTAGALQLAGSGTNGCNCSTPIKTYYKNWGPRLGFAYAVDDKTVIRASFGMYYALGGGTGGSAQASQPDKGLEIGFSAAPSPSSPGLALPAFYLNGNTTGTLAADNITIGSTTYTNDPTNKAFNNGTAVTAPGVATQGSGYGTYYSTGVSATDYISSTLGYLDPKFGGRAPEFTGWSFGLQRSLTKDMTATLSYVGNEGHHLVANNGSSTERGYYSNQLDPKYLTLGAALGYAASTASTYGLSAPSWFPTGQAISQMLLPFPQYKGVADEFAAVSNSNYNSMQLTIEQRLAHGLTLMLNYTFSKSIDNAGTFRSGYDIPAAVSSDGKAYAQGKADRSLSNFDQRHNVTGTTTYDLPFGSGHIGSGNAIVRNVAGGWRVSGIFTYVAGNPLTITQGTCSGISGQGTCMPAYASNFTGKARINGGWGHGASRTTLGNIQYINPAAFALTGTGGSLTNPYVIGSVTRTAPYGLRGPGNYNIDASVRRTFNLWSRENVKFVFEANAFNALNHVWFGSTSTNATGSIGQSLTTVTPNTSASTASTFGTVAGQANTPRVFQFAGHITF